MTYILQLGADTPCAESSNSSDGGYFGDFPRADEYGIYIPAPARLSPVEAFSYHLTTRNLFACMVGKPVVGFTLGQALMDLLDRMNVLNQSGDENEAVVLAYMDHVGYLDFRECPDHALAVLNFAERFEIQELWTDAFVHCAGMDNRLIDTTEFEVRPSQRIDHNFRLTIVQKVSSTTKTSIMRTRLEMDILLKHAERSLSTFLEDELSAAYLGLGSGSRLHLDRFRSFLHSYYVQRYGYWPPSPGGPNNAAFSNSTFRSMYFEFRNLYECLLDPEATSEIHSQKRADGGLCVFQNVAAFDRRHNYAPLPHPLPLLPQPIDSLMGNPSTSFKFRTSFGGRKTKMARQMATTTSLVSATNTDNATAVNCPLVQEYMQFEVACTGQKDEKISLGEGRKVRWILIYSILQVLVSVSQAPKEVRDTDSVSYPLCMKIPPRVPWTSAIRLEALEKSSPKPSEPIAPSAGFDPLLPIKSVAPLKSSLTDILQQGFADAFNPSEADSDSSLSPLSRTSGWSYISSSSSEESLPSIGDLKLENSASAWRDTSCGTTQDNVSKGVRDLHPSRRLTPPRLRIFSNE